MRRTLHDLGLLAALAKPLAEIQVAIPARLDFLPGEEGIITPSDALNQKIAVLVRRRLFEPQALVELGVVRRGKREALMGLPRSLTVAGWRRRIFRRLASTRRRRSGPCLRGEGAEC